MDKTQVTPDGWVVTDIETFRLIADYPPPRPYGYLRQFGEDARNWKPITMWAVGAGTIAVAVATGWRPLLVVGVVVLAFWFVMFRAAVRYLRDSPATVGLVGAMTPHPLLRDYSTGVALLADGREVPVDFPTRLADGIIGGGRRAEVLFLEDPRGGLALVLGARAALGDGDG
jgi:hypothetical protein